MKVEQAVRIVFLLAIVGGVFPLPCCKRPSSISHKALNPVNARGFPIWTPSLPECIFTPTNPMFAQYEPYSIDSVVIHTSAEAKCGGRVGSFSQLQMVVLNVETARRQYTKFWDGIEDNQLEQLIKQPAGYVVSALGDRAWVKLGNIWLHLRGDTWLVKKLAVHYVKVYNEMVHDIGGAIQKLGVPEQARSNFEVLYEYREYHTNKK